MSSSTDRRPALTPELLRSWEQRLALDDSAYGALYPGPPLPGCVHTVYLPVPRFTAAVVDQWRSAAQESTREHPDQWTSVLSALAARAELGGDGTARLRELTSAKLDREPIEDLRIDFEDGFRAHRGTPADDQEEDGYAISAAALVARAALPRSWGLRIRSLGGPTRTRSLRTLQLFLAEVLGRGPLPPGFVLTLPKVTSLPQITVFCAVLAELELVHGLPSGSLRFEIQVETPQTVLGADGTVPVARMIHSAGGRVSGLHFGTYDYTASLGILAAHQNLRHPVADFAKSLMLLAAAETGVRVSDGSDNKVPVGDPATVERRWSAHADGVTRALRQGIFQGWDMHPAQLPTRFAATFAFFRAGWQQAAVRLGDYHRQDAGTTGVLDEPATAFALARHLAAALACGAVTPAELLDAAAIDQAVVSRYLVRGAPPGAAAAGGVP